MGLEIKNLSFGYTKNKVILDNISFAVGPGTVLGILGPNGTGKTTMLKCINNILHTTHGKILWDNNNILQLSAKKMAQLIGYVPQYNNNTFSLNVIDCVMMGRMPYVQYSYSEQDKNIAFDLIKKMDLEKFALRPINQMSGGERQRVFIARALAQEPQIIILDEPTSSLDLYNQLFILHIITKIAKENNILVILTIHDMNLASMFCDKILMLKDSHVFAYGDAQDVLTEENINSMYGVHVKVSEDVDGKFIRLLKHL